MRALPLRRRLACLWPALLERVAGALVALAMRISEDWCPPPRWWPSCGEGPHRDTDTAVALLLNGRQVFILAPAQNADGEPSGPTLHVNCSDLFYWGTADAEPLPALGFSDEDEATFWDLYDRARRSPEGADIWCCLRRGMRPQTPLEERWRKAGVWTAELEALPARAPGTCG